MSALKITLLTLMSFSIGCVFAQAPLSQMCGSGIYSGNHVDVLVFTHVGEELLIEAPGGISTINMQSPWNNQTTWLSATIEPPPSGYLGFRNTWASLRVNPIYWGGAIAPSLDFYTPLETDPVGDHLYSSNWLDITSSRVSFSQDRLYFAITNNHSSFPVSSGLTYYAYMPVLVNPNANPEDDPIVFGLMYTVSVPGIISPGLYKISGTGFGGLTLIGQIEQSVEDQTLLLSCALSDLLADPDFNSWFDVAYPYVSTVTTSSRITLINGIQQADVTEGAKLLLKPQPVPITNNLAPVLSQASYTNNANNTISVAINYFDADSNFPRQSYVAIDGGEPYPLYPEINSYVGFSGVVPFTNPAVPLPVSWSELVFSFSHGDDWVTYTLPYTSDGDDAIQNPLPSLTVYPNPATSFLKVQANKNATTTYAVYNLRGQKLISFSLEADKSEADLDISLLKPGVYFIKAINKPGSLKRFVKL